MYIDLILARLETFHTKLPAETIECEASMNPTIKTYLNTFSYTLRAACMMHVVHFYFYEFTETRGESMIPTIAAYNDYVHVLKKHRDGKGLKIGDCIVAVKPTDPSQRVCKRITGMPGDIILVDPSMGFKQSYKVEELDSQAQQNIEERFNSYVCIPEGHVWVTGDNLSHSLDSRCYNSLPMGLIRGKIVAANDLSRPFWNKTKGNFWGFRRIENNYITELEEKHLMS